jgi:hypothetical protein
MPSFEDTQNAVNQALDQMDDDTEGMAEEIRTLTEAQRRLRKANYYQTILSQPLFEGEVSEEGEEVEDEMREFALKRLRCFLGMEAEEQEQKVQGQFDDEEILALKVFTAKCLGRPPPTPDTVEPKKRAPKAVPPQVKLKQVQAETEPTVKRRRSSAMMRPQPEPAQQAKVVEVQGRKLDGSVGTVKVNVTGPVQPPPEVARMPFPSSDQIMAMEQATAYERESNLNKNMKRVTEEQ